MALPILYTLSLLLHGLVAWRLLPALDPAWAAGLAPVLLASALLLPMGLLAHRVAKGALADRLAWVGLLCMGLFSSLLVLTALRDVMLAAVWVAATLGWSPAQALLPGLREQVMVDVSHANSSKQHRRQIEVAADVARQISAGDHRITGLMVESHLQEGRQDIVPGQALQHGVSVTDACISMEQTVPLLQGLAAAARARRAVATAD